LMVTYNDNGKNNMPSSPKPTIDYLDDLDCFNDLKNEFPAIVYNDGLTSNSDLLVEPPVDMAPLPYHDPRYPWLRYHVDGYDKGIIHSYEQRLETIWGRQINRVHILDFTGLTKDTRQTLGNRLSMIYSRDDGEVLFTSHAWRRLFEVRGPLFILALGLHSEEETAEPGFGTYWVGSETGAEKVTGVDLFYLQTMDRRTAKAADSSFGLISDEGLRGLSVVVSELPIINLHKLGRLNICSRYYNTWAWVAPRPERRQAATAGTPVVTEGAPAVDEGAQAVPAPVQATQPSPLIPYSWMPVGILIRHLIAPSSAAHDFPTRGVSNLGQAMLTPLQLLGLMTSPTLDLLPLTFLITIF
nr:hypothetical protein [Tanacetum cinerariifolium]